MTRSQIKLTVAAAVFLGLLLLASLDWFSSSTSVAENKPAASPPSSPPPSTLADTPPPAAPAASAPEPAAQPISWEDKLAQLQAKTESIFGQRGEENLKELQNFVESLAPTDLPGALKKLQKLEAQNSTPWGQDLEVRILRRWADGDIHSAANWTTSLPAGKDRQNNLAIIASVWAKQNFSDASTWALQLPDGPDRQAAVKSVAYEEMYTSPLEALKLARTLPVDSTRDELVTQASSAWASSAPEDAVIWAKQLTDENLRNESISAIAMTWGDNDPVAAANLAISSLPPGQVQNKALVGILQRWAQTDAAGAAAWANQFPEGPLRQMAQDTLNQVTEHKNR